MISVVIPTSGRAGYLSAALDSLALQTLPKDLYEVLVVDNISQDNTREIVRLAAQKLHNLRYFYEPVPGLHAGRHRGLREARGDVLAYIDDDVRVSSTWLEAIIEGFSDPKVVLVGGNNYPDYKSDPPVWIKDLWQSPFYGGNAITYLSVLGLPEGKREIAPHLVWGCNFSVRKNILVQSKGFHPDAMPESLIYFRGDGETHVSNFVAASGFRTIFDSHASVWHIVTEDRMTIPYFKKRAHNQGISDSYLQLRNHKFGDRVAMSVPFRILKDLGRKFMPASLHSGTKVLNGELDAAINSGYRQGFDSHQALYNSNPEVRAWVHKEDYF